MVARKLTAGLLLLGTASAFVPPSSLHTTAAPRTALRMSLGHRSSPDAPFAPVDFDLAQQPNSNKANRIVGATAAALLPLVAGAGEASAKGGELGIWEGRTFALVHPVIMGSLFLLSGYAAILGLQWRELRTMGNTINLVKEQAPMLSTGKRATLPFADARKAIEASLAEAEDSQATALKADLSKLAAAISVDQEYASLLARRKELTGKNVRDKHYETGSIILGLGVFAAIEGPVNTYIRAGKLFPGPHLYAGAGIAVAWAAAAALVQPMQKGNDWARTAHIAINFGIIGFFLWQVNTGLGITAKVLEFTKWP